MNVIETAIAELLTPEPWKKQLARTLRDTAQDRDEWRSKAHALEVRAAALQEENTALRQRMADLESEIQNERWERDEYDDAN